MLRNQYECVHFSFSYILTAKSQVRLYSTSHRDIKPPSFDDYRWSHKKDPTRATDNEKQMTYHYLVTGGSFIDFFFQFQLKIHAQMDLFDVDSIFD